MTEAAFNEWASTYCAATGAGAGTAETLRLNYRSIVTAWKATLRDLGEIAFRLVSQNRIPKWPNEHLAAIGAELDALRKERSLRSLPPRSAHECAVCDGIGLVVVPHPCCVYQGRVTGFYDAKNRIRRREVLTIAVVCTAAKCYAGEAVLMSNRRYADEANKPKLLTMDGYLRRIGPHLEPTVILREWERDQAARARAAEPRSGHEQDIFRSIVGNILARQETWAESPYRDDAEVQDENPIPA